MARVKIRSALTSILLVVLIVILAANSSVSAYHKADKSDNGKQNRVWTMITGGSLLGSGNFRFKVTVNPASATVDQGDAASTTVTATLLSSNTKTVSFSASGLPSGVTVSFNPTSCDPTCISTATISTSSSTPTGTYPITITGKAGKKKSSATYTLTVQSSTPVPFDFSLSANPASGTVAQGSSAATTTTATLVSGTPQSVSLSCTGLPSGASCSFSPTSGSPTFSSTATISTASTTPAGTYPISIIGTGGGLTRSASYSLTVTNLPTNSSTASCQRLSIPAYFDPSTVDPKDGKTWWDKSTAGAPATKITIMNPSDGPGTSSNSNYVREVQEAQTAGIKVLGYVFTGYGTRSSSVVKQEVDLYKQWYKVDGIFYDEVSTDAAYLSYYTDLANYARSTSGTFVMLNPGTIPDERYMNIGDVVVVFEDNYNIYTTAQFPSWINNYPSTKFAHLVIETSLSQFTNALALSKQRNAGYVYITDDTISNPWDTLPSYWDQEVQASKDSCSASFDFSMSVNPTSGTVQPGNSVSTTTTATLVSGSTQPVSFSYSGQPAGVTISFNPTSGSPTFSSPTTISTSGSTPTGTYPITISGTGGGLTRSTTYTLTVATSPLTVATTANTTSGNAPLAVSFTCAASNGTSPYSYSWAFGDGTTGSGTPISHIYSAAGTYTAKCTATDSSSPQRSGTSSKTITVFSSSGSSRPFDYVVIIEMENQDINDIYGSPNAPYMTSLANTYTIAKHDTAIDHPSEPNYLAIFSGLWGDCYNTNGGGIGGCMTGGADSTSDCGPDSACTMGNTVNFVDRIEAAGLTWKAYSEDLPTSNPCTGTNPYPSFGEVRHFPFFYFTDITLSSSRCAKTFHATADTISPDNELVNALGSTSTAANFMYLSPDDNHNMHDNSVQSGDAYLSVLVPRILNSNIFQTQKAVLFITFDEGNGDHEYPIDYVYSVWAGPVTKRGYSSTNEYTTYSFLKTLETAWGLSPMQSTDANAPAMKEFFTNFP